MRDPKNTYDFLVSFYDLMKKHRLIMVNCPCEECRAIYPEEIDDEDEIEEFMEELLCWYQGERDETACWN